MIFCIKTVLLAEALLCGHQLQFPVIIGIVARCEINEVLSSNPT